MPQGFHRAAAGPFRSSVALLPSPGPTACPLMMALRLIPCACSLPMTWALAKTIEAALIARELLDRGGQQLYRALPAASG